MTPPQQPVRRILVECTYTYFAGGNSGIRRVARNLANLGREVSTDSVEVVPLVWGGIGFFTPRYRLGDRPHPILKLLKLPDALLQIVASVPPKLDAVVLAIARRMPAAMHAALSSAWKALRAATAWAWRATRWALGAPWRMLRRMAGRRLGNRGNDELFYLLFGILAAPVGFLFASRVRLGPGDVVVLVDSTWNSDHMLDALLEARNRSGVRLGVMLHDLFPLTLPHMCHEQTVAGYTRWFDGIAPAADFFITNSEATRSALETHLRAHPPRRDRPWHSGSFRLGATLDLIPSGADSAGNASANCPASSSSRSAPSSHARTTMCCSTPSNISPETPPRPC